MCVDSLSVASFCHLTAHRGVKPFVRLDEKRFVSRLNNLDVISEMQLGTCPNKYIDKSSHSNSASSRSWDIAQTTTGCLLQQQEHR